MNQIDYRRSSSMEKSSSCSLLSLSLFTAFMTSDSDDSSPISLCCEDAEASMFRSYRRTLPNTSAEEFISRFLILLDRRGIDAALFLKPSNRRVSEFTIGMMCTIRSHFKRPNEVEFGVRYEIIFHQLRQELHVHLSDLLIRIQMSIFISRNAGVMKRIHFNWADVTSIQEGTDDLYNFLPPNFTILPGEDRAKCFLFISTKLKGNMQMVFKSELLRNACLNAFRQICGVSSSRVRPVNIV